MPSVPWTPERATTLAQARAAIAATGYDGPLTSVEQVAIGWDNTVLRVDDVWVFRLPRRAIALPGIEREIAWLPRLTPLLTVAAPSPRWSGTVGDPPWPFWGAPMLPGAELAQSPDADRVAVARQVGTFLRALHALPTTLDDLAPLPVDPMGRADTVVRAGRAAAVLDDLASLDLWRADDATLALLASGATLGPPTGVPVLSHGDLYGRHVLVDGDGVTGIIDWGDLCLALPCVDLSIAWSSFSGDARAALLDAYGPANDETLLRAQVFAVFMAASLVHYAHDTDDEVLLAEFLGCLGRVAG